MKHLVLLACIAVAAIGCSSSNDAYGACVSWCNHESSCTGQSSSSCGADCSNYQSAFPMPGASCTNYTALFNCLAALPCSDYTDGGTDGVDYQNCLNQGGCTGDAG